MTLLNRTLLASRLLNRGHCGGWIVWPSPHVGRRCSSTKKDLTKALQDTVKENMTSGYEAVRGTIIGLLAKRMTKNDMEQLAEHWGNSIKLDQLPAREHAQQEGSTISNQLSEPISLQAVPAEIEKDAQNPLSIGKSAADAKRDVELFHPILGELLIDLQYKRLYLTNVRSLAVAPVWKKNRILRPERAAFIAQSKIKRGLGSSLPGVISFYADCESNTVGIVDGQHRAAALMTLAQKGYWDDLERNVLIEVFYTKTEKDIAALFRAINSAEPVRLIDAHLGEEDDADDEIDGSGSGNSATADEGAAGTGTSSVLSRAEIVLILTEGTDKLKAQFPDMFKPSSRCRPPHLNIDVLRDDLFQADFVPRLHAAGFSVRTSSDLLQHILAINAKVGEAVKQQDYSAQSKYMQNAIQKARAYDFYLGINKNWIYDE